VPPGARAGAADTAHDVIRIGFMNLGGLTGALDYIAHLQASARTRLDVLCCAESKCHSTNQLQVIASNIGARWVGNIHEPSFNPATGCRGAPWGGVGALIFNRNITAARISGVNTGVCTISLHAEGKQPISCIVAYMPHEESPHVRHFPDHIRAIEDMYRRELQLTQQVLVMGDFNTRLGNSQHHHTKDKQRSTGTRRNQVQSLLDRLRICQLHGRSAANPASCTSWAPIRAGSLISPERRDAGAEVDFIAGSTLWQQGDVNDVADFATLPTPKLGDHPRLIPPRHAPLTVCLPLRNKADCQDRPRDNHPRHPKPPAYPDKIWYTAAEHALPFLVRLREVASQARSGDVALMPTYETMMTELFNTIQQPCAGHQRNQLPQHSRYRKPIYIQGRRMPEQLLMARDLVAAWRNLLDVQPRGANGTIPREQRQFIEDGVRAALRHKKRLAQRLRRTWILQKAGMDEHMLRWDAHTAAVNLGRENNHNPLVSEGHAPIPSAPGQLPAETRFRTEMAARSTETRNTVPAASDPEQLRFVPRAPEGASAELEADFQWQEIMRPVFPVGMRPEATYLCHPACTICREFEEDRAAFDASDPHSTPPQLSCHLHTSTAAGPDGQVAEWLAWLRPEDHRQRFDFRQQLCTAIADFFNGFKAAGCVPDSFKTGLSIVLFKAARDGSHPDRADPDNYRVITMGNVISKLYGLVWLARLSHWSERHRLIETNYAFRPGYNCEQHVIAMMEVLKERTRNNHSTWLLFVDFKKAYDNVHLDTLWTVASTAGVPRSIVNLLREWNSGRTTIPFINGKRLDSYPLLKGVPQGDVLSPWLFNLFIESLARQLKSTPAFQGVQSHGIRITDFEYADDVVGFASSRAQAMEALAITARWGRAWGLELGLGRKKTEVMVFGPGPHDTTPLTAEGVTVSVTGEYRYLGLNTDASMSCNVLIDRYADKLRDNFNRFFRLNGVINKMSLRAQIIICKTFVTSTTNFLASALPAHKPAATASLDAKVKTCLKHILRLPGNPVTGTLWVEGKVLPTLGTWVRERYRVFLEFLLHFNPRLILHQLIDAQLQPAALRAAAAAAAPHLRSSWSLDTLDMVTALSLRGISPPFPAHRRGIKDAAAVYGRMAGLCMWQDESLAGPSLRRALLPAYTTDMWFQPPPVQPAAFVWWRHDGYTASASAVGAHKSSTPLSTLAPGCSGCILGNVRLQKAFIDRALHFRQGRMAYLTRCSGARTFTIPEHCANCAAEGRTAPDDPYHHIVECPSTAELRERYRDIAAHTVRRIAASTLELTQRMRTPQPHLVHCCNAVEEALSRTRWASTEGNAILFRLVLAQTWSIADLPADKLHDAAGRCSLAAALGRLFDSINLPPYLTQALCTRWAVLALKIIKLCDEHRERSHPRPWRRPIVEPPAAVSERLLILE